MEQFLSDKSENAYEQLIDRLLASRTTASAGAGTGLMSPATPTPMATVPSDTPRPYAWKYRDYVIRSFNADKPLDRFIIEQLAGDELVPPPWNNLKPEQIELLTATGFLRTAPDGTTGGGDI